MRDFSSYSDDAFTGLEAAIVLIAFVVVAAVFSYVVLGAGFYTTQKSQEAVYKSVEQSSTNIQLVGNVYGVNESGTASETEINYINFSIGLAPGSPSIDLEKLTVLYSTTDVSPQLYIYTSGAADTSHFSAKKSGAAVTQMQEQDHIDIQIQLASVLPKNKQMTLEIRPAVGAALPFTRTTAPYLYKVNVL